MYGWLQHAPTADHNRANLRKKFVNYPSRLAVRQQVLLPLWSDEGPALKTVLRYPRVTQKRIALGSAQEPHRDLPRGGDTPNLQWSLVSVRVMPREGSTTKSTGLLLGHRDRTGNAAMPRAKRQKCSNCSCSTSACMVYFTRKVVKALWH